MPTYEFVCPNGHQFDKFYRKMSDAVSDLPCAICGETAIRKISGGAGLVFKGSGFYITDYGKDGKKGMTPPTKASASEGEGGGSNGAGASAGKGDGAASSSTSKGSDKPTSAAKSSKSE